DVFAGGSAVSLTIQACGHVAVGNGRARFIASQAQTMTSQEAALMQEHGRYWVDLVGKGIVVVFGPVRFRKVRVAAAVKARTPSFSSPIRAPSDTHRWNALVALLTTSRSRGHASSISCLACSVACARFSSGLNSSVGMIPPGHASLWHSLGVRIRILQR